MKINSTLFSDIKPREVIILSDVPFDFMKLALLKEAVARVEYIMENKTSVQISDDNSHLSK